MNETPSQEPSFSAAELVKAQKTAFEALASDELKNIVVQERHSQSDLAGHLGFLIAGLTAKKLWPGQSVTQSNSDFSVPQSSLIDGIATIGRSIAGNQAMRIDPFNFNIATIALLNALGIRKQYVEMQQASQSSGALKSSHVR